jgi:rsbT co-antagonist protein RsbR
MTVMDESEAIQLKSRVSALEELLEVYEATVVEQSSRLEGSLSQLRKAHKELEKRATVQAEAILELSTPVIHLADRVLLLPLIGVIDTQRAQQVMDNLLHRIAETSASVVLVDITGVPVIDTYVAEHLLKAATASRLLGAEVIFTGVNPHAAQTITKLGIDLSGLVTKGSLRDGLITAFRMLGIQLN